MRTNYLNIFYYRDWYQIKATSALSLSFHKNKYKSLLSAYKYAFANKHGLEIGGPTQLFASDMVPVYQWAKKVDGCNFSSNTIWEGAITNKQYTYFPGKTGEQFILDGTDLNKIKDSTYDFLLSSHNLEHIANPLKAIAEWRRVLKPGGFILLVLPDKNYTFDRKRDYTTFEHLVSDLKAGMGEDDLTHLPEILRLHDFALDPRAGNDLKAFKERGEHNLQERALHHHVFSQEVLKKSLEHYRFKVLAQCFIPPYNQIILGQKEPAI